MSQAANSNLAREAEGGISRSQDLRRVGMMKLCFYESNKECRDAVVMEKNVCCSDGALVRSPASSRFSQRGTG